MNAKPKRRWYQFSLLTLLLAMTVLCVGPGGWIVYEQRHARNQGQAIRAIEKISGRISYDPKVPQRPDWLKTILGDDSFKAIDDIRLDGTQVTDADLDNLLGMPNL